MRDSGEALVKSLGLGRGQKVLDLGCGDGTTAMPAAKAGADVLGVDISRQLVAAGNQRAAQAGLPRRYYGPTMNAFDAAEKSGRSDTLAQELEALFSAQNRSASAGFTTIPATFLLVDVQRDD